MTQIEDHRKKKGDDDEEETNNDDKKALELGGVNPLAAEEAVEDDETGGD